MPSSSELRIERRRRMGRPPRGRRRQPGWPSRCAPRTADARLRTAVQSSISQQTTDQERRLSASLDPAWRVALGLELRDRRRGSGLTQGALGAPLTKGFVSAVEHGRTIPSLPALRLMTDRLGVPLGEFLRSVDLRSTRT